MTLRIVRLGTPRMAGEGLRIGTVRRPPRGVPKDQFAAQNWYDLWYPDLAPSAEAVKLAQAVQKVGDAAAQAVQWTAFVRQYRREMAQPQQARTLDLLAALSHHAAFSVGCYCEDEARCHRSLLRDLLAGRGADIAA